MARRAPRISHAMARTLQAGACWLGAIPLAGIGGDVLFISPGWSVICVISAGLLIILGLSRIMP